MWLILNGKITIELALIGLLIDSAVYIFACKFLHYSIQRDIRILRLFPYIVAYIGLLLYEIIKANIELIKAIYMPSKAPDPIIVTFSSSLMSDPANAILANSITLTPGTVTISQRNGIFVVHCLRREYSKDINNSSFIKLLRKIESINEKNKLRERSVKVK